jgi:hypothetical protein
MIENQSIAVCRWFYNPMKVFFGGFQPIFHILIFPPKISNVHLLIIQTTPLHGGRLLAAKRGFVLSSADRCLVAWWRRAGHLHTRRREGRERRGVLAKQHGSSSGHGSFPTPYTAQCNELNERLRRIGCGAFEVESVNKMQGFNAK